MAFNRDVFDELDDYIDNAFSKVDKKMKKKFEKGYSAEAAVDAGETGNTETVEAKDLEEYYDMRSVPCGLCAIFNMKNFRKNEKNQQFGVRNGTDVDRDKLKETFEEFNFIVKCYNDFSTTDMKKALDDLAETDHTNYNCFVCCILSHGEEGLIFGSDSNPMNIHKDIVYTFSNSNCPTLIDKPKLFIIQACQGSDAMPSATTKDAAMSELETDGPSTMLDGRQSDSPHLSDFVLALSTIPGFASFRHRSKGSWFISELTNQLNLLGDKKDILDVLTCVIRKLKTKVGPDKCRQIPNPSFTTDKKVKFNRRH